MFVVLVKRVGAKNKNTSVQRMTARLAVLLRMEIRGDGPGDEAEGEDADGEEEDAGDFEGIKGAGHGAAGEEKSAGERGGTCEKKYDAGDGGLRGEMRGDEGDARIDGDGGNQRERRGNGEVAFTACVVTNRAGHDGPFARCVRAVDRMNFSSRGDADCRDDTPR